jgi:hypothetical protein
MGLKTVIIYAIEIILGLVLIPFLGIWAILIGLGLASATFLLRRRGRKWEKEKPLMIDQRPMRLRQFISLLWLVALVAILFSPSTLRLGLGGGSNPLAPSFQAAQAYLTSLESKYRVTIVNDTNSLQQALSQPGKKAYFLLGPDINHNLTSREAQLISNQYQTGTLSLLLVEGNRTNNAFLNSTFDVQVRGDAIVDNSNQNSFWPHTHGQIFPVNATLDGTTVQGLIDVASPIIIGSKNEMWTVADSSHNSTEVSIEENVTADTHFGPRTVIAGSQTNNNRALLVSDSSPFSTEYNATFSKPSINETAFAMTLTEWVTHSDPATRIIVDNTHYTPAVVETPGFGIGLPVGRIFALVLAIYLRLSNQFYTGFLDSARPYLLGIALFAAWGFYGTLTKRYAKEKRGKDDEPVPWIEKSILAESREKKDFLTTSRKKGFYVATLDQLYDVLDSLVEREFGARITEVKLDQLTTRLGQEQAIQAEKLFKRLGNISRYSRGEKRLLLPPVLRWKSTTRNLTGHAERILNQLGVTMTGRDQKKQLAYKLRRS